MPKVAAAGWTRSGGHARRSGATADTGLGGNGSGGGTGCRGLRKGRSCHGGRAGRVL